ncbi:uncharacterized protein [Dysidea avara]|uniref:uncharacterized protein n=1 Tax=Dysidea avara TaxID=196820 RepID=UPI00331933C2
MADHASKVVKLNIGGVVYETTSSTLCSCGDNFFTRLLSTDLSSLRDEAGAFVIDRTGEYFAPILHFMRSRLLVIPEGMNVEALKGEAEFYLVTDLLAKLQEQEEEQRLAEDQTRNIRLADEGCYVNETRGEAFLFLPNDKLICVKLPDDLRQQYSAYDQAMVVKCHQKTPTIWKEDQNLAGQFAQFFTSVVSKGFYKSEGQALRLSLATSNGNAQSGVATWKMASISTDALTLLIQCDPKESASVPFARFTFKEF